jgi:hypothetical protein
MIAFDQTMEDIEAVESDRELKRMKREQAAQKMKRKR